MSEAKIAGKSPAKVELENGKKYAFCTCGESAEQPFCDGAHKGSSFAPIVFTAEKDETAYPVSYTHLTLPTICSV